MKRSLIVAGFFFMMTAGAMAQTAAPVAAGSGVEAGAQVLATVSGPLTGAKDAAVTATKQQRDDGIYVVVKDAAGAKLFESENIGTTDKTIDVGTGAEVSLGVKDVTGDGVPELLAAAFYGPQASGMYIWTYDAKTKKIVPIKNVMAADKPADKVDRDFFVSDIDQSAGQFAVLADNSVRVLGQVFDKDAKNPPVPAYYHFALKNGQYEQIKLEKIAPPPDAGSGSK